LIGLVLALAVGNFASNLRLLQAAPAGPPAAPIAVDLPPLASRVVLVVVDSLAYRVAADARLMPGLGVLGRRGASGILTTPAQSNTAAGVTALGTGAATNAADLLGLFHSSEIGAWTVFDAVLERGDRVAFNGTIWSSLFASRDPATALAAGESTWEYLGVEATFEPTLARLAAPESVTLAVVHLGESDRLAHLYGTEDSRYEAGIRAIDESLRRFSEAVLDGTTTLIVTSDHGNDATGNHGGPALIYREVPVVIVGAGIEPGVEFSMEARGMPAVLATLLGTALPADSRAITPASVFDLDDRDRARVVHGNAVQLEAELRSTAAEVPTDIERALRAMDDLMAAGRLAEHQALADATLPAILSHIGTQSPPSLERFLWALALGLGISIVGMHLPLRDEFSAPVDALLAAAIAIALLRAVLPVGGAAATGVLIGIELVAIADLAKRMVPSERRLLGLAGAAASLAVVVTGLRFSSMGAIKAYVGTLAVEPALFGLAVLAVGTAVVGGARLRHGFTTAVQSQAWVLALGAAFVLTLTLWEPFSALPVVMMGAVALALLASGRQPVIAAGAVVLMAGFFFVSGRFFFAWSGENPVARYSYAIPALVLAGGLVALGCRGNWRRLAAVLATLGALWPFGYFKVLGHEPSSLQVFLAVAGALLLIALWARRRRTAWISLLPLATTGIYFAAPADAVFLGALVAHLVGLGLLPWRGAVGASRNATTAATALSAVILMSHPYDVPSLPLLLLGLYLISRLMERSIPEPVVVLVGAVALCFGRYAFVDLFTHEPNIHYSIGDLDLAPGFYAYGQDSLLFSVGLVVTKMLMATLVVLATLSGAARVRGRERIVLALALAMATGFLLRGAIEAALSYGAHAEALSESLSASVFHTGLLFTLAVGYGIYELLCNERTSMTPMGTAGPPGV
jgi:hypothetical protein